MGSYLMACAVSNATLDDGCEVVAYPMMKETGRGRGSNELYNNDWFVSDMPIFGKYNDSGNVITETGEEIDCSEHDLMVMHRWAWDFLMKTVHKEYEENDENYARYNREGLGYINYRLKSIADARKAIDMHLENKKENIPDYNSLSVAEMNDLANNDPELFAKMVRSLKGSSTATLNWFGEGSSGADAHWRNMILEADDPHDTYNKFLEYVLTLYSAKWHVFFRLAPSMYASSETNADTMIQFYEEGLKYFKDVVNRD